MRPGVVGNFVSFARGSLQDLRILLHAFAEHEKRHLDMARSEQVEQLGSQSRVRTIIESQSDVRPIDVDIAVDQCAASALPQVSPVPARSWRRILADENGWPQRQKKKKEGKTAQEEHGGRQDACI